MSAMAVPRRRLLAFSDLDGRLLDKETYSGGPAAGAMQSLAQPGIPLILSAAGPLSRVDPEHWIFIDKFQADGGQHVR